MVVSTPVSPRYTLWLKNMSFLLKSQRVFDVAGSFDSFLRPLSHPVICLKKTGPLVIENSGFDPGKSQPPPLIENTSFSPKSQRVFDVVGPFDAFIRDILHCVIYLMNIEPLVIENGSFDPAKSPLPLLTEKYFVLAQMIARF